MTIELYHHGSSVCAAKVRLCLAEKGRDWHGHYIDILKGDQFDPGYLKLNPKALVPTLVHDGRVLTESTVICEYLDEVFPDPPLKPTGPYERAVMRIWTKAVDEDLHSGPVGALTFCASHRYVLRRLPEKALEAFLGGNPDPVKRARKRRWVEQGFDGPDALGAVLAYDKFVGAMETRLAQVPWLAGQTFTLADVGAVPYIVRLDMLAMQGFWRDRPHVAEWFNRINERPSFQPAFYQWIPDDLLDDLASNGANAWPEVEAILAKG
tara:strand:+ start:1808 stop:2605 length:798 start_codon:yes stop_codon:yes gene_type:complete